MAGPPLDPSSKIDCYVGQFGSISFRVRSLAHNPLASFASSLAPMLRNWSKLITSWINRREVCTARRRHAGRRHNSDRACGAEISRLEVLESRELLSATATVAVHVHGNSIQLSETGRGGGSTDANFSVSYTSSQVVLTGTDGTTFRVSGQTETTDTIALTGPASLSVSLNRDDNVVSISGDGSSSLSELRLHDGAGSQSASVTLDSVIADSVNLQGRRANDSVTVNQSTVNGNLTATLGNSSGDALD